MPLASFSKWVSGPILSYEIKFNSYVNYTHFHMNGFAPGLASIERLMATRKCAIA